MLNCRGLSTAEPERLCAADRIEKSTANGPNLGTLWRLHNPLPAWCGASGQRMKPGGGGTGSGNGDRAVGGTAAVSLGLFTLFGRIGLWAFGSACNSAITGLGLIFVVADLKSSPGTRVTSTVTVAGWKFASA
jgi:hypothetical protein